MGQMDIGKLVMLDDGSFMVKSTDERVWKDDDGNFRNEDGEIVDVDNTPSTGSGNDGLDFTE